MNGLDPTRCDQFAFLGLELDDAIDDLASMFGRDATARMQPPQVSGPVCKLIEERYRVARLAREEAQAASRKAELRKQTEKILRDSQWRRCNWNQFIAQWRKIGEKYRERHEANARWLESTQPVQSTLSSTIDLRRLHKLVELDLPGRDDEYALVGHSARMNRPVWWSVEMSGSDLGLHAESIQVELYLEADRYDPAKGISKAVTLLASATLAEITSGIDRDFIERAIKQLDKKGTFWPLKVSWPRMPPGRNLDLEQAWGSSQGTVFVALIVPIDTARALFAAGVATAVSITVEAEKTIEYFVDGLHTRDVV
jgi:hypothetical protein